MHNFRYLRRYFRSITPNSKFWTTLIGVTIGVARLIEFLSNTDNSIKQINLDTCSILGAGISEIENFKKNHPNVTISYLRQSQSEDEQSNESNEENSSQSTNHEDGGNEDTTMEVE